MNKPSDRVNVLGVKISAITPTTAREKIFSFLKGSDKGYVCVTGVHGVIEAQDDPNLKEILNNSFLSTPDGMPMTWMGRLQGNNRISRVYGPNLMWDIMEDCNKNKSNLTHFFYGSKEGVADNLKKTLEHKFPNLNIVGTYCPPFRELNTKEEAELTEIFKEKKPDITWVGISTPKQEKWMAKYLNKLETRLMFGVGAAFDFHTGMIPKTPKLFQKTGMEWFYRLCSEPRRLWRRYLKNNPRFIALAFLQLTKLRKFH